MVSNKFSRLSRGLFILSVIIFTGCQNEATLEETTPASQPRLQVLSPPELPPAIRQHALSVGSALQKQALSSKNERSFGPIANGPIHRVDYPDGRVSYTLPLRKLGTGLYYDNLVIQQLANGTTTETLIRYEPEQAWWKNSKGTYNYATYSGRVSFYTVAGEPLASVVLQEGKIAPSPADKTGTAQRIEVSCYITDIQYAGLEQDGTFYITDIMYWFECEVYVDGNMSPDGGGYGTGGTGGGVGSAPTGEPEYAEDGGAAGSGDTPATGEEEEETPCEHMEALQTDVNFKNKMDELKNGTGLTYEKGYTLTQNEDGTITYTPIQGDPAVPEINFSIPGAINGYIHSHCSNCTPDSSPTYSNFSAQDVKAIYELFTTGNIQDTASFVAGVVTTQGTSYTLMIEDTALFSTFGQANFGSGTSFSDFENYYNNWFSIYKNVYLETEITSRELALLKALENSGLALFRGNDNFSDWQGIRENNNAIIDDNCN